MTTVQITSTPQRTGIDAWSVFALPHASAPPIDPEELRKRMEELFQSLRERGIALGQANMKSTLPWKNDAEYTPPTWKAMIVANERYCVEKTGEGEVAGQTLNFFRIRTFRDISWLKGEIATLE